MGDILGTSVAFPCICGICGGADDCFGRTIGKKVIPPEPADIFILIFAIFGADEIVD
jgi:hypothetical protein